MEQHTFVIPPSSVTPFRVEVLQYIPERSYSDGLTLLFTHAMNVHKETYHVVVTHLLGNETVSGLRIKDVWCIDNPNQGRSAVINEDLLTSPAYIESWSASEYAKATWSFLLATPTHGVDFRSRKLVGISHSAGSTGFILLHGLLTSSESQLKFQGFVFLDPAIMPATSDSKYMRELFRKGSLGKKDAWPSRAAAYDDLRSNPAYKGWNPDTLKSFVENALRPDPRGPPGSITWACSRTQEAAFYRSEDVVTPTADIFLQLTRDSTVPIHLILCREDEYRGKTKEMRNWQIGHINKMAEGSLQYVETLGHMFPQIEPKLTAKAIGVALGKIDTRLHKL